MPTISILLAATVMAAPTPSSAEDLLVRFTRGFCLQAGDPVSVAERLVPRDWTVVRRNERRNVIENDFHGKPSPPRDVAGASYRGTVGGAVMWLEVGRTDYADPAFSDYSQARFGVSPDTLINLSSFENRLSLAMRPRWKRHEGVARPALVLGDFHYPAQPRRYGWLQHYILEPQEPVAGMEITARHYYGSGFPRQELDLTCSRSSKRVESSQSKE